LVDVDAVRGHIAEETHHRGKHERLAHEGTLRVAQELACDPRFGVSRGENYTGSVLGVSLAEPLEHTLSRHVGHAEIEEDGVVAFAGHLSESFLAARRGVNRVPLAHEVAHESTTD